MASRILGMGDVVGLMKEFEEVVDEEKAEQDAMRMLKGKFDMNDFLEQIGVLQKMGSLRTWSRRSRASPTPCPKAPRSTTTSWCGSRR